MKMKKNLLLVFLSLILVAGIVVAGCAAPAPTPAPKPTPAPAPAPSPQKVVEWKVHSFMTTAQKRQSVALQELWTRVEKATEGRVKPTLYPVGALVPPGEMLNAVGSNTVQAIFYAGAISAGQLPVSAVEYGLPMSYGSTDDIWGVLDKGLLGVLQEAYGKFKIHFLTVMTPLLPVSTLTTKPINSLGDFKAMKVRALGPIGSWFTKLGASPVSMPMAEIYMALKLGTIEGAATGLDVHVVNKNQEVCKYWILPDPVTSTPLSVQINIDAWNALSAVDREIITKVAKEWSKWCVDVFDPQDNKETFDALKAAGVQKIQLPPDDVSKMQAAAVEVWDEFAKTDPYAAKAVAIMKDYFKAKGRIK